MVKFKRNYETPMRGGNIRRRAIVLTFVVVTMVFLMVYLSNNLVKPKSPLTIKISMLDDNLYLIDQDTSNYEDFASKLKKRVIACKKASDWVEIKMTLPKNTQAGNVADILMVANAFDGVRMKLLSER